MFRYIAKLDCCVMFSNVRADVRAGVVWGFRFTVSASNTNRKQENKTITAAGAIHSLWEKTTCRLSFLSDCFYFPPDIKHLSEPLGSHMNTETETWS